MCGMPDSKRQNDVCQCERRKTMHCTSKHLLTILEIDIERDRGEKSSFIYLKRIPELIFLLQRRDNLLLVYPFQPLHLLLRLTLHHRNLRPNSQHPNSPPPPAPRQSHNWSRRSWWAQKLNPTVKTQQRRRWGAEAQRRHRQAHGYRHLCDTVWESLLLLPPNRPNLFILFLILSLSPVFYFAKYWLTSLLGKTISNPYNNTIKEPLFCKERIRFKSFMLSWGRWRFKIQVFRQIQDSASITVLQIVVPDVESFIWNVFQFFYFILSLISPKTFKIICNCYNHLKQW